MSAVCGGFEANTCLNTSNPGDALGSLGWLCGAIQLILSTILSHQMLQSMTHTRAQNT